MTNPDSLDNDRLANIEARAVEMAREAGRMLEGYFEKGLEVSYKGEGKGDPVTVADKEVQDFLASEVSRHFPAHGFLGEEDEGDEDPPAPDVVWVVDPLDGTRNFASGLPVFACSIGVLHRGAPVAGAMYVPWRGESGSLVLHARKGGGAFADDQELRVDGVAEPDGVKPVSLAAAFGGMFSVRKPLRGRLGDRRVSGSIVFDMALTAKGAVQYAVTTGGWLWDFAAGATILSEAGGVVLVGRRSRSLFRGARISWEPLDSFVPDWRTGETSLGQLRRWSAPLVMGNPQIARYVAANLKPARQVLGVRL